MVGVTEVVATSFKRTYASMLQLPGLLYSVPLTPPQATLTHTSARDCQTLTGAVQGRVFVKDHESLNIWNVCPLSHSAAIKIQLQNGVMIWRPVFMPSPNLYKDQALLQQNLNFYIFKEFLNFKKFPRLYSRNVSLGLEGDPSTLSNLQPRTRQHSWNGIQHPGNVNQEALT